MAIVKIAPAKINLFLHITGKRNDGYHTLQSLIGFADFGDRISITDAERFSFTVVGEFTDDVLSTHNLVLDAITAYIPAGSALPAVSVTLEKNIPVGAGLGGGSSDAAAMIKILEALKIEKRTDQSTEDILLSLGADVPVCYHGQSCFMEGIGETIAACNLPEKLHAVLVYPQQHCATADIFADIIPPYTTSMQLPSSFNNAQDMMTFITRSQNDMSDAAINKIPEIKHVLMALSEEDGCTLSRMSGSGSCCFGLFIDEGKAKDASDNIQKTHPEWFVRQTIIQ